MPAKRTAKSSASTKREAREKRAAKERAKRLRDKNAVFKAYGGYVCRCCQEKRKVFLSIDHVNGGGTKHRKKLGFGGIYRWLVENDFPPGFQVLCHNCNQGRHLNGGTCPHEVERRAADRARRPKAADRVHAREGPPADPG